MAESQNASFIPKRSNRPKKHVRATYRIYVLGYISYVLFFGTLLLVAGTFFYSLQIDSVLEKQKIALASEREDFDQASIEDIRNFEQRLLVAENLLSETNAPSHIFDEIESIIVDTVVFNDFTYERLENKQFSLKIEGETDTFNDVLFQRQVIGGNRFMEALSIEEFNYDTGTSDDDTEDGQTKEGKLFVVNFSLAGEFDTALIPYDASVYARQNLLYTQNDSVVAQNDSGQQTEEAGLSDVVNQ